MISNGKKLAIGTLTTQFEVSKRFQRAQCATGLYIGTCTSLRFASVHCEQQRTSGELVRAAGTNEPPVVEEKVLKKKVPDKKSVETRGEKRFYLK